MKNLTTRRNRTRRRATSIESGRRSQQALLHGKVRKLFQSNYRQRLSSFHFYKKKDLQKIEGERKVTIKDMIRGERYVYKNRKPLELLGYKFVRLEVAGVTVSKARVLVLPNSEKSIVGLDWLVAFRYKSTQPIERGECKVNSQSLNCNESACEISPEEKRSPEVQQLEVEFPNSFKRKKGRVKNYEIKIKMKEDAKIT